MKLNSFKNAENSRFLFLDDVRFPFEVYEYTHQPIFLKGKSLETTMGLWTGLLKMVCLILFPLTTIWQRYQFILKKQVMNALNG
jgi:hypothetical protein